MEEQKGISVATAHPLAPKEKKMATIIPMSIIA